MQWLNPYPKDGSSLYGRLKGKSGIYFIRSKYSKKLLYIGMSATDLFKTLTRHFQQWNDIKNKQHRAIYDRNDVEIAFLFVDKRTVHCYEVRLIHYFNPPDNRELYLHWNKKRKYKKESDSIESCPF